MRTAAAGNSCDVDFHGLRPKGNVMILYPDLLYEWDLSMASSSFSIPALQSQAGTTKAKGMNKEKWKISTPYFSKQEYIRCLR